MEKHLVRLFIYLFIHFAGTSWPVVCVQCAQVYATLAKGQYVVSFGSRGVKTSAAANA
jgi:hypothetical protein